MATPDEVIELSSTGSISTDEATPHLTRAMSQSPTDEVTPHLTRAMSQSPTDEVIPHLTRAMSQSPIDETTPSLIEEVPKVVTKASKVVTPRRNVSKPQRKVSKPFNILPSSKPDEKKQEYGRKGQEVKKRKYQEITASNEEDTENSDLHPFATVKSEDPSDTVKSEGESEIGAGKAPVKRRKAKKVDIIKIKNNNASKHSIIDIVYVDEVGRTFELSTSANYDS